MELGLIDTANKPIYKYHKYDSTTAQEVDSEGIRYVDNKVEIDSIIYISDDDKPKYIGDVEIHKNMDAPEETITS